MESEARGRVLGLREMEEGKKTINMALKDDDFK